MRGDQEAVLRQRARGESVSALARGGCIRPYCRPVGMLGFEDVVVEVAQVVECAALRMDAHDLVAGRFTGHGETAPPCHAQGRRRQKEKQRLSCAKGGREPGDERISEHC